MARQVVNMVTNKQLQDSNNDRVQLGGVLLGAGLILFAAAVIGNLAGFEEPTTAAGASDAEVAAAEFVANEDLYETTFYIESMGLLLAGVGALMLSTRPSATSANIPPSGFWMASGIGAILLSVLVAVEVTAGISAAKNYATAPALFEAMDAGFAGFFGFAGLLWTVSLALVMVAEANNTERVVNPWLAYVGALGILVAALGPIASMTGVDAITGVWTAIGVIAGALVTALFGLAIPFPGLRFATGTKRTTGKRTTA